MSASVVALLAALLISRSLCLAPIEAVGAKLYDSESGEQFYIRGIAYSVVDGPNYDALSNPAQCKLDAALMETLGVNTVRVYTVGSETPHDECMKYFDDAEIYVLIDLATPTTGFKRAEPEWTMDMFTSFTKTLDAFAKYNNLLAVIVGTEIINDERSSIMAPYIKAAIRDIKAYRDGQGYRRIPVGYSAADINSIRLDTQNYLVCGSNVSNHADFFSMNLYSWCGNSTFIDSGYSEMYDEAENYPVPIFLSESGCNNIGDSRFGDQEAILGPQMNDRYSGAVLYEWKEESNSYGVVSYEFSTSALSYTGTGTPAAYTPTPISPDFYNLQSHWNTLTPTGTPSSDYTPTYTEVSCPTSIGAWSVRQAATLPTIDNLVITTKPAASSPVAADISATQIVAAASSPTAIPNNTSSGISSLSTGTKAAIGVAVPLVVVALVVVAFFLWRWRRRRRNKEAAAAAAADKGPEYSQVSQNSQGGGGVVTEFFKPEVEGNPVAQLHADDARHELGSQAVYQMGDQEREPAELEATNRPPQELSNGPSVRRLVER
ncbi:MAG: hypothetical protein LQ341_000047 [Variospora aurantia]|nr:MAG: hypothetical protein LQ341_000047 [Variospora aurantia]